MAMSDKKKVTISFADPVFSPIEIESGSRLSDVLDGPNSPVFFGCKSGNCGTCLIELDEKSFSQAPLPDQTEQEYLTFAAADNPLARLACQLVATADLHIKYLTE